MGTTTPKAIPFPEPTDPVAQGAAAMRAMAERTDDLIVAQEDFTTWTGNDLRASAPFGSAAGNPGSVALPAGGIWTNLPLAAFTSSFGGQYLLIVMAQVWPGATGGRVQLAVGLDGAVMGLPSCAVHDCSAGDAPSMTTMWLGSIAAGAHNLSACAWNNGSGGSVGQGIGIALFLRKP